MRPLAFNRKNLPYLRHKYAYLFTFTKKNKKTMASIYVVAGLDARPVHFSNGSKLWAALKTASGSYQIWHGAPAMDKYRLKPVNNYGGLKRALERDNYTDMPVFWNENGAVRVLKITRCTLL